MSNKVTVAKMRFSNDSTCNVSKRCNKRDVYQIFGGDGEPMLSRLAFSACQKHLVPGIDLTIKQDQKTTKTKE